MPNLVVPLLCSLFFSFGISHVLTQQLHLESALVYSEGPCYYVGAAASWASPLLDFILRSVLQQCSI